MRYLVLSDIHANIHALDAVLADAARHHAGHVVVLGDLVGYGANPNEVIDRLQTVGPMTAVRGNHDKAAVEPNDAEGFNAVARRSARWTFDNLTDAHAAFLRALPQGPVLAGDQLECCHGTPFNEDAYVFDEMDAVYALQASRRPVCLYGHTHIPASLVFDGSFVDFGTIKGDQSIVLMAGTRYLLNAGSVGQPRDGDSRAAYGVIDLDARTFGVYRVKYPVERAQASILDAGLPDVLAQRLRLGR